MTEQTRVYTAPPKPRERARTLVIHLRLHFQALLAPIFLWGFLLAGGNPSGRFLLAFIALHLFLYGGTTAFNSYYDRDEGPIGGLEHPPPVTPELLPFSLIMQAIGFVLAAFVNAPFFVIYFLTFIVATAYSHPRTRLKRRPLLSLLVVGWGQGGVIALAGWITARPNLADLNGTILWGILGATLMITGIYPVTQIYQIDEDLRRGDVTFAAWAGAQAALRFAILLQALGATILVWLIYGMYGTPQAALIAVAYGGTLALLVHWSYHFEPRAVIANYRRVMRITMTTSLAFMAFLALHLFGFVPS